MIPRFESILSRIVWLHLFALGVAAIAMPIATYFLLNATANEFEDSMLHAHADAIAKYLSFNEGGHWTLELPGDLRTLYLHGFDGFSYSVVDESGKVLYSSLGNGVPIPGNGSREVEPAYFQRSIGKSAYYGASFPERRGARTVWVQVAQDLQHPDVIVDDIVAYYLRRVAWLTIPIMLLLFVTDIFIVRRAIRPILRASNMARTIEPSRIDLRLPTKDIPREVLPLVNAVNQALDRLEKGFREQREFTANAAHELRTPLTVLRTRVETLADQQAVALLRADLEAISHIMNQLLAIAELDGMTVDTNETVDLRIVCADVVANLAPIAIAQDKEIAFSAAGSPILVQGNAAMLQQAVRNLAENALRHTPTGTAVEIDVEADGTVRILDRGPGVATGDREKIFRRFWRRDRSRSDGAGLGLSIVARIAEAHGGTIEVENRQVGGAMFTLSLNAAADGLEERS